MRQHYPDGMPETPPGPADITHPRRALARLALSAAAADLAEVAAALVPTIGRARPGDHVSLAAQLLDQARDVLDRAVVYEHDHGTSWREVGEQLDVTKQSAHERFGTVVADWESGLDEPYSDDGPIRHARLPDGATDPDASAARLDRWCTQHAPASTRRLAEQDGLADKMVSAGLPQHTGTSEIAALTRQLRHLTEHDGNTEQRQHYEARRDAVLRSVTTEPCTCTITDSGDPNNEVRHRDDTCPVHRGR